MAFKFNLILPDNDKSIEFESIDKLIDYIQDEYDFENSDYIDDWIDDSNRPCIIGNSTYKTSIVLKKVDPVAFRATAWGIVESEIKDLKYGIEHTKLKDGATFYCYGLKIKAVETKE